MPKGLRVQVPPPALVTTKKRFFNRNLAYLVGAAIGDGNLSNPNGRAVRLRITCDIAYPNIVESISSALREVLPGNKIGIICRKDNCVDVSCYSNKLEEMLGWQARGGSKYKQKISVPKWILDDEEFSVLCLKGLFETDGSIYEDREYTMVNFVTIIPSLSRDVFAMISSLGFRPNLQIHDPENGEKKYTIRVSKNADEFIKMVDIKKIKSTPKA